ncbi:Myb/SANT-like DNA-binding domain [Phytophthora infestans]|uniref:Myb/SANT-like DNA-binding domain n=1 Tax=Phytophthora infestans TaxID=4787 RepID=A0A8S9V5G1_PHYIN|nr:Myb/SANT-like DNA-binding domain [Phytophthora infestans]
MNLLGVLLTRSVTDEGGSSTAFLQLTVSKNTSTTKKSKTVSSSKKSQGSKSKGTKTKAAKEKFLDARNERELATDKGIKSKAWHMLVAALNRMHKRKLSKDQYKSKFVRLMHDYDLYKSFCSLTGAGMGSDTPPTLDDDVWEHLMASKP